MNTTGKWEIPDQEQSTTMRDDELDTKNTGNQWGSNVNITKQKHRGTISNQC